MNAKKLKVLQTLKKAKLKQLNAEAAAKSTKTAKTKVAAPVPVTSLTIHSAKVTQQT